MSSRGREPIRNGVDERSRRSHSIGYYDIHGKQLYTELNDKYRSSEAPEEEGQEWWRKGKEEKEQETPEQALESVVPPNGAESGTTPQLEPGTAIERPQKRQKRTHGSESIESSAVPQPKPTSSSVIVSAEVSTSSSPALSSTIQNLLNIIASNTKLESSVEILEQFLIAATQHQQIDPNGLVTVMDEKDKQLEVPFVVALIQAHKQLDQHKQLIPELYQPYRNQLKSLIRRTPTELTLKCGTVTPNCTLLHYVIYSWTINNREHVAYDWLCGLLETPNYPIDVLDCHRESALSSWSQDKRIKNGLIFHTLVQAGAMTDRRKSVGLWCDRSFMTHLLQDHQYHVLRELLSHGYEHLCLDGLFQKCDLNTSRKWRFPQFFVWEMMPPPMEEDEQEESGDDNSSEETPVVDKKSSDVLTIVELKDQPDEDGEYDGDPHTLVISMRNIWLAKYRSHIISILTEREYNESNATSSSSTSSSTSTLHPRLSDTRNGGIGMVLDCAIMCVEYLDDSGRSWWNYNVG